MKRRLDLVVQMLAAVNVHWWESSCCEIPSVGGSTVGSILGFVPELSVVAANSVGCRKVGGGAAVTVFGL